jgi:hypothetical protein
MNAFLFLLGVLLGGLTGWWLGKIRAAALLGRAQTGMRAQVRQWQEVAARAQSEVARLTREAETWAAGCKQGREDVISIMPLLVAAQQRPANPPAVAADDRG